MSLPPYMSRLWDSEEQAQEMEIIADCFRRVFEFFKLSNRGKYWTISTVAVDNRIAADMMLLFPGRARCIT